MKTYDQANFFAPRLHPPSSKLRRRRFSWRRQPRIQRPFERRTDGGAGKRFSGQRYVDLRSRFSQRRARLRQRLVFGSRLGDQRS